MDKRDLRHIVIIDDPCEKITKKQLEKASKWVDKTLKKRLNTNTSVIKIMPSRLYLDDEQGYTFDEQK